jgi:hypothetical protein
MPIFSGHLPASCRGSSLDASARRGVAALGILRPREGAGLEEGEALAEARSQATRLARPPTHSRKTTSSRLAGSEGRSRDSGAEARGDSAQILLRRARLNSSSSSQGLQQTHSADLASTIHSGGVLPVPPQIHLGSSNSSRCQEAIPLLRLVLVG